MGAELIVKAVQVVYSAYSFIGNERWKRSAEKRFRAFETQLQHAQERISIIDPQYTDSEEFSGAEGSPRIQTPTTCLCVNERRRRERFLAI